MKIGTFSVVCGTQACQAKCPFCISKMTNTTEDIVSPGRTNWRNLEIACRFATKAGATIALITGKGEPTLYPDLVEEYIRRLQVHFPFVELQTNGMEMWDGQDRIVSHPVGIPLYNKGQAKIGETQLKEWWAMGLTLVCLSIVHYDSKKNYEIMSPNWYYNFWNVVDTLHRVGLSVRINCTMVKDGVDTWKQMETLIKRCKEFGVEQLTLRDVTKPEYCDNEVAKWTEEHQIKLEVPGTKYADEMMRNGYHAINGTQIATYELKHNGAVPLLKLNHGATVYDFNGQNVCLNNCITETTNPEEIRQLIFFPDGRLFFSWNFPGARIL